MGFFNSLTGAQRDSIEAVGIDRAGSYQSVVKREIPKADIVYDKFHIVSNFHAVVDDVRRQSWNNAEGNEEKKFMDSAWNHCRIGISLSTGANNAKTRFEQQSARYSSNCNDGRANGIGF